jgi:hypothetical protein
MRPFNIKNNCFGGQNPHQQTFSLSKLESNNLLSPPTKENWKMNKMKSNIKIEFYKIQGTNHLISKKNEGFKWVFNKKF